MNWVLGRVEVEADRLASAAGVCFNCVLNSIEGHSNIT